MKKATLALTLLLLPWAAAGAEEEAATEQERDAAVEEALPVERDYLFVEESLPFLPATNTIATKLPLKLERTPANVGIVELAELEEQNAIVLGDALENVSGLNVQTGNGVFDFFVVRGFDSLSSGLVVTDGAPEPEVTFYQLYNTERVEVFKGPAGFLYGSNPLAGVVNLVRKQPVPNDFGLVGFSMGSWETYEGRIDFNRTSASGALDLRLNGLWRESEGYRDGRDSQVAAFNPALTWRPTDSSSLNLNVELVSSDYRPDAGLPYLVDRVLEVPRSVSYASPFDRSQQDVFRAQVDYDLRLSDSLSIRNKTYFRRLDWISDGTLISGILLAPDPEDVALARSLVLLEDDQDFAGNQFEVVARVRTGGLTHRILAGLELARFRDEFTIDSAFLPDINVLAPVETARDPLFTFRLIAGDAESEVIAPYVIDQIEVSDRVQLLVGARFDSIDFSDDLTGSSRSDSELSPIAGVVFAPGGSTALYANFARSFAPPAARVQGEREPEKSEQIEVGVRQSWLRGRARGTFAVYRIERENGTLPDETGAILLPGDKRSRGLEIDFAAELPSGWRAQLAYAYTDSELTSFRRAIFNPFVNPPFNEVDFSGNVTPFAPEHVANLWLGKRVHPRLRLAGGLRYVDEQYTGEDNVAILDSYFLVSGAATWSFDRWRLRLNLENLLDEEYETRGFGSSSVIPGKPLSFTLGIEYRL